MKNYSELVKKLKKNLVEEIEQENNVTCIPGAITLSLLACIRDDAVIDNHIDKYTIPKSGRFRAIEFLYNVYLYCFYSEEYFVLERLDKIIKQFLLQYNGTSENNIIPLQSSELFHIFINNVADRIIKQMYGKTFILSKYSCSYSMLKELGYSE